ncbi:hypothetical protein BBJ28_00003390 [Nothophytophthora sp. Chile5]|nr:hypothetical protein BBJ28_00003390 [Nothophytophthora sp. Chile5]
MKSRWVDSIKRGITSSPRGERSPQPFGLAASQALTSSTLSSVSGASVENPAFTHDAERCDGVGVCSVARVLEQCVLQGGVHHTHMHVLTYLGRPLRSDCCCYPVAVQWFRAVGELDDFQVIPGACDEWYTPTADDIGARILAKVMIEDEDVLKTKMLEYGPIKEDPEVRSKVEMYLERKSKESMLPVDAHASLAVCHRLLASIRFTLQLEVARGTPNEFYLHLAEGCYVRLRAESNTVRDIIMLTLRAFCKVAISNDDAAVRGLSPMLTLRTLAQHEEAKKLPPVGVSTSFGGLFGLSCMLRLYTPSLDFDQQTLNVAIPPVPLYDLPWNRTTGSAFGLEPPESTTASTVLEEIDESLDGGGRRLGAASSVGGGAGDGWLHATDGLDDSLLLDAEALIGNAQKMGIQYQILPRAPKRISILDIPDLQIIEAMEALSNQKDVRADGEAEKKLRQQQRSQRRRRLSAIESDSSTPPGSFGGSNSGDSDSEDERGGGNVNGSVAAEAGSSFAASKLDASCIDKAIEDFMADGLGGGLKTDQREVAALRERYVAIFCALQRELHTYKQRVLTLSKQLEEKQELNTSFRKDIESLRSALTSMQVADKVYDMVTTDLQQLVKHTTTSSLDR